MTPFNVSLLNKSINFSPQKNNNNKKQLNGSVYIFFLYLYLLNAVRILSFFPCLILFSCCNTSISLSIMNEILILEESAV